MKLVIIDYGSGNLKSVENAFKYSAKINNLKFSIEVTNNLNLISKADHLVLPGVGSFPDCKRVLQQIEGLIDFLTNEVIKKRKKFLGICVGMQLLANISYENGEHKGLGWIDGRIKKIPDSGIKLPHMGWNNVIPTKKNNLIENSEDFYFVHSYYFKCKNEQNILAETQYGINFSSIVVKENIYGVQFHPEKSSSQGLKLIKNFVSK